MYEVATGLHIWNEFSHMIDQAIETEEVPEVDGVSDHFKDLMKMCL